MQASGVCEEIAAAVERGKLPFDARVRAIREAGNEMIGRLTPHPGQRPVVAFGDAFERLIERVWTLDLGARHVTGCTLRTQGSQSAPWVAPSRGDHSNLYYSSRVISVSLRIFPSRPGPGVSLPCTGTVGVRPSGWRRNDDCPGCGRQRTRVPTSTRRSCLPVATGSLHIPLQRVRKKRPSCC